MEAVKQIHGELATLKQRRMLAVSTYAALILVFFGSVLLQPTPGGIDRDIPWTIAFVLLLVGSLLGAAITIGYPLVSRNVVYAVAGIMGAGTLTAFALVMDPSAAGPENAVAAGMKCFMTGTSVSAVAMVLLGIVSGRVWRRFPDPGFVLALGMTGVGLGFLHMRCGGVDPLHLLFHLAPMVVLYAVAYFAVRTRSKLLADD